jgi:prevent-host-death family protein
VDSWRETRRKAVVPVAPRSSPREMQVEVEEAATRLPELVTRVERGEEVVITRAGVPVAAVVPVHAPRRPGRAAMSVPADFDEPLPDDELDRWEGRRDRGARCARVCDREAR